MYRAPSSDRGVLLALFAAFATSACANLSGLGGESKFKCSVPDGVPCMSMSEVDSSYRAGVLPGQHRPPPAGVGGSTAQDSLAGAATGGDAESSVGLRANNGPAAAANPPQSAAAAAPTLARWLPQRDRPSAPRQPVPNREAVPTASAVPIGAIRTEPTIIRIWIAPWEDADGDLNDQGYVYLQIDAGRWLIEHNREQIRRTFAPTQAGAAPSRPARPLVGAASPKAGAQP